MVESGARRSARNRTAGETEEPILRVEHLSKKYCHSLRRALWYGVRDIARELALSRGDAALREGEFWAVDDVSFTLSRGESLAIVGHNGAGKSTLLKLIHGILKPDRGAIRTRGRVAAIIELGVGFHPVLSGRENIALSAALHGMSAPQSAALEERVVELGELADVIDAPVQAYSSGMRARLAYALAAQLDPDVLLVDEALAVGDVAFQRKCATHMHGYLARGGALILVSHSTYQVQSVCARGMLMDRGRIVFAGSAVDTLQRMFEMRLGSTTERIAAPRLGPVVIENVLAEPIRADSAETGQPLRVTVRYRADEPVRVMWGFGVWTADQWVCVTSSYDPELRALASGEGELTCVVPKLPLVGGRYALRAGIIDPMTNLPLALFGWEDAPTFLDVRSEPSTAANVQMTLHQLVRMDIEWD